jgi:hypothetical protein
MVFAISSMVAVGALAALRALPQPHAPTTAILGDEIEPADSRAERIIARLARWDEDFSSSKFPTVTALTPALRGALPRRFRLASR